MNHRLALAFSLAAAAANLPTAALADDIGQHPAVFAPRSLPAIDPSTFIVGHPASPSVHGGHANGEHPAVGAAARARAAAIDPNAYRVQPPASTAWTLESAGSAAAAPSATRTALSAVR